MYLSNEYAHVEALWLKMLMLVLSHVSDSLQPQGL